MEKLRWESQERNGAGTRAGRRAQGSVHQGPRDLSKLRGEIKEEWGEEGGRRKEWGREEERGDRERRGEWGRGVRGKEKCARLQKRLEDIDLRLKHGGGEGANLCLLSKQREMTCGE